MRHQDQLLLKQFVDIHNGIHSLKRQQEVTLPRCSSDMTETKPWREMKRSGAIRHEVTKKRAFSALQAQPSASASGTTSSDWSYVQSLSHEHVDSFMEQVRENLHAPRMQLSHLMVPGEAAPASNPSVLHLDVENDPNVDSSEC